MSRDLSIRLSVALAALAIGSSALQAANKLTLSPSSITATCNAHINGQTAVQVTVKPATTLTTGQTIVVTLPSSFTGGLVVTPPSVTTLSTTNQAAGIVYNVALANACTGVTNAATPSFAFLAGGTADASLTVTTDISSAAVLSLTPSSSTLTCSLQSGPTPVTVTVKPVTSLTGTQTIAVTLPSTFPGGLTVTPPSTTTLSTTNQAAGIAYSVSTANSCAGVTNGAAPSFNFLAGGTADAPLTLTTALSSSTTLVLSPASITPTCSTATGPSSVQVTVKPAIPLTGSATIAVGLPSSLTGGLTVTAPSITTLSTANQAAGIVYTVSEASGCVGVTNNGTPSVTFTANTTADAILATTTALANSVSGLSVSNATVVVNCVLVSTTYTPGAAQNVSVTSTATGGTPFSLVTTGLPAGVSVTPSTFTGSASSTATAFSIQAAAGCGGASLGSTTTGSLVLHDTPGPDKTISVALQVTGATPLTATPSPASLSYVKGSGSASSVAVAVTSSTTPAPFFTVDTTSLPIWLTVDAVSGSVPKTLHFSSTSVCDSLAPGTYTATVRLNVATYGALSLPVSMLITNSAPKLTVTQGTSQTLTWTLGQPLPIGYITLISSDSPIPYTLTGGGPLQPVIAPDLASGLAYSFGTEIPVTFNSTVFAAAQPASVLTGTVTVTWGNPSSTTAITFNVDVLSPQATLSSISPGSLPTAAAGQSFTVVLTGTGFVPSSDLSQKTKVGVVSNGVLVQDTNIASNVVNSSNMILTITVPAAADTYLPFTAGGNVTLGVCNPQGATCSVPSASVPLAIGNGPVIQEVTSASSFQQVNPGQTQSIAPYDMISVFGTDFCSASAPACSSSQVLPGVLNPSTLVYQNWLAIDAAGPNQRQLTVAFCPTGTNYATSASSCTNAPLLFATNNQINLLVPGSLSTGTIDLVVNYGNSTAAVTSSNFTVNVVATDPGIFAVGADGQGSGAILSWPNYTLVNAGNPAGVRSTAADSDVVQIYMTGLGAPTSSGGTCITTSDYLTALSTASNVTVSAVDGAIMQSALLPTGDSAPCLASLPSVSIGGVAATSVSYAGWVADSVAGLYQVNVTLPGSQAGPFTDVAGVSHSTITAPVQLPIIVTAGSNPSQTGVSIWVAPRLKVTAPTLLTGQVGVAWGSSNNAVAASEGTTSYRYAVTSGVLPTGLSLSATSGAITGTPAAGTTGSYVITVTATDSAYVPLTGTTTFTLTISGGLILSGSNYTGTVVSTNTNIVTVTSTGGVNPNTYSFDSSFTAPAGMTIGATSGIVTITSQTPAGTYNVKVDAVDANGFPGTVSFTVTLKLVVTAASASAGLTGTSPTFAGTAASGPFTVSLAAVGGTGSYTFTTPAQTGFSITGSVLTISAVQAGTPYTVVITATDNSSSVTGTITLSITMN